MCDSSLAIPKQALLQTWHFVKRRKREIGRIDYRDGIVREFLQKFFYYTI